MAGKHNVGVTISAKDLASGVIQKVSARTVALGVAVGNLASKMIAGAVNGVRRWIDEALEAERANVMLDAALRGTGQYTDALSRKMKDLAGAIQDETGASDEAVKGNIALLTTMGVTTDKMGEAARAVQALSALNFEGSQAAKAVALAMEGNMLGFQRMIPALRNAKTEAEKVEAVNKVLAAGYEQQRAKLATVGGAWEALKGRLGDAREDIMGAVFDGLKLGQTFDSMQAAVGRFLQSDTFNDFTERLKSGAAYVRQIVDAMSTDGGTKEVIAAMGGVILGALKDGADYVADSIRGAFGKLGKVGQAARFLGPFGWLDLVGRAARFGGAKSAGASTQEAWAAAFGSKGKGKSGGNFEAALAKLNSIIKRRSKIAQETANEERQQRKEILDQSKPVLDIGKAVEETRLAQEEKAKLEQERKTLAEEIKDTEDAIKSAADREQSAKEEIADAEEKRAGLLKQGISEWIKNQQDELRNQEDVAKQDRRDKKRAQRLRKRQDAGARLSARDAEWLNLFDKRDMLLRDPANVDPALMMAQQAKAEQDALNQRLEKLQEEQTNILEKIEAHLKASLEVQ